MEKVNKIKNILLTPEVQFALLTLLAFKLSAFAASRLVRFILPSNKTAE